MADEEDLVKTRIYLGAPFPTRTYCVDLRFRLKESFGPRLEVDAQWLHDDDNYTTDVMLADPARDRAAEMAVRDLRGVHGSHGLVLYNPPEFATSGTGGRHGETGAALVLGKPVFLLGVASNIFHRHPRCYVSADEAELRERLHRWIETRGIPGTVNHGQK